MDWSPQQQHALDRVRTWLKRKDSPIFRIFGYAGTGKTTLAKYIGEQASGEVLFAAFTGKAALVLRSKGCTGASTIHSLIYKTRDTEEETLTFQLNPDSPLTKAQFVIIDECSMVDAQIGEDLLSFKKPIIVLGDPAQLPPIQGGGFFVQDSPDVMLTDVHRQALENPIIRLAMEVREGKELEYGQYGESHILARTELSQDLVLAQDQLLVGRNRTRKRYNARIRSLLGYVGENPQIGDKLVCLRNDRKKGLLNGSLWKVMKISAPSLSRGSPTSLPPLLRMRLSSEEEPARKNIHIHTLPQFFETDSAEPDIPPYLLREVAAFDYGYALTVHKAQGSQWPNVLLFDESRAFREHRNRWLYTGITRASHQIIIVR